mmetsp:Transcript_102003/g.243204  ORF Transcript_102003/g.243204 Transcript_102003/m.243204 type:complete len:244 (-) Transcript_102003:241-972(-)
MELHGHERIRIARIPQAFRFARHLLGIVISAAAQEGIGSIVIPRIHRHGKLNGLMRVRHPELRVISFAHAHGVGMPERITRGLRRLQQCRKLALDILQLLLALTIGGLREVFLHCPGVSRDTARRVVHWLERRLRRSHAGLSASLLHDLPLGLVNVLAVRHCIAGHVQGAGSRHRFEGACLRLCHWSRSPLPPKRHLQHLLHLRHLVLQVVQTLRLHVLRLEKVAESVRRRRHRHCTIHGTAS